MAHILIAGAGAAGLFAAGAALAAGHAVTLVEPNARPGRKLAITGKGRCNLTCNCDVPAFLAGVRANPRFLHSAAAALPPAAVMARFEALGVPLKTERGRRVFPQSDAAEDVVDALLRWTARATFVQGRARELLFAPPAGDGPQKVTGLRLADGRTLAADAVLVATGGMSYPVTGSTGDGYALARQAGHAIVPPQPSLVALVADASAPGGGDPKKLPGLSLRNVALSLLRDGKPVFAEQGELLFTHFGLSGPIVLSASAYLGDVKKHKWEASIDLKPALSPEVLDARLQRDFAELAAKDAANSLMKLLPKSLCPVVAERWGVPPRMKAGQLTRAQRQKLGALLKDFRVPIAGRGDLEHAVVTAGGVDVREVDPKTMQSRLARGLYFAGEVLDLDAFTGGYNLQIAWCTGAAAARAI